MAVTPDLEKRRVPRIPCRIRVVLADGPLCARGVTADISSLGAYVRMENPWPKGTVVTFTIKQGGIQPRYRPEKRGRPCSGEGRDRDSVSPRPR